MGQKQISFVKCGSGLYYPLGYVLTKILPKYHTTDFIKYNKPRFHLAKTSHEFCLSFDMFQRSEYIKSAVLVTLFDKNLQTYVKHRSKWYVYFNPINRDFCRPTGRSFFVSKFKLQELQEIIVTEDCVLYRDDLIPVSEDNIWEFLEMFTIEKLQEKDTNTIIIVTYTMKHDDKEYHLIGNLNCNPSHLTSYEYYRQEILNAFDDVRMLSSYETLMDLIKNKTYVDNVWQIIQKIQHCVDLTEEEINMLRSVSNV